MKKVTAKNVRHMGAASLIQGVRVGKVTMIDDNGKPFVDFAGNTLGPVAARFTSSVQLSALREAIDSAKDVLLAFENNDPARPIIIDTLFSLMDEISEPSTVTLQPPDEIENVTIDGRQVTFNAQEEIVLRCGRASITLTRAGKIIIKGAYLLSRSSGVNRIKGGSVQIN